ncbi:type II CAAX prenyl endopeptidase Rce1 family protein [Chromobacterium sp. IIBBL 290-4]|uniref:CPBP family glutamic-type intramembrane protease n=1 Tax=Chromobacterium sp. IIBBL 290-4 TaxID=2953890 RepID=UPI0020B855A0|nr:CPBP family glutamic-type intramembrane protease [Chromobacterium sp. IIBBL 290-4]UTH74365.1 hypothetical protein NKT35_22965 [Chromobacterium sp. IIBBL 290-4]
MRVTLGPFSSSRPGAIAAWQASWWAKALQAVIFAPLLETFIFQVLVIELARRCRFSVPSQYLLGILVMFLPHAWRYFPYGIVSGIFMGFSLTYCYLHWRERSCPYAFWTTAATHSLYNALVAVLLTAYLSYKP